MVTVHTKTIVTMNNIRLEKMIILHIFILLVNIINSGYSATVPNKDDLLYANITMKNFETTKVYIVVIENFYS